MEVRILEEAKNSIKIEVIGEDHTLANAIRQELWNDKDVVISGHNLDHPLISNPVIVVETSGKKEARKAFLDAIERLKKKNNELIGKLQKL
jgi:DNA-directed RNA polymerase subunit L